MLASLKGAAQGMADPIVQLFSELDIQNLDANGEPEMPAELELM